MTTTIISPEAPPPVAAAGSAVHFASPTLGLRAFVRWRGVQIRRQYLVDRLMGETRRHLAVGEARYLAVFAFDGNSHVLNAFGRPERWQFDLIFDALAAWGLIRGAAVDVGAHFGLQSLYFADRYQRVSAIEPNPHTFRLLDYNLSTYAPNGEALQMALGAAAGRLQLSLGRLGNTGAFTLGEVANPSETFEVEVGRLDDLADQWTHQIGLIKIDTEGAEHDVLIGARETLVRDRPVVLMEDWKSKGGHPSDAVLLLRELGYETILVPDFDPPRRAGAGRVSWARLRNVLNLARHGHRFVLRECDFSSPRGYDLLLALHRDHAADHPRG